MGDAAPLRAVILAAGLGSRLGADRARRPKCLTPLAGKTILDFGLTACADAGCSDPVLVTGFEAPQIRRHIAIQGAAARTVDNLQYASTGTAKSLQLGLEALARNAPVAIIEGDTAFDPQVLARLLACGHPIALAAATYDPAIHSGTRIFAGDDGRVSQVVHASVQASEAADLGVFKTANVTLFRTPAARKALDAALLTVLAAHGPAAPLEFALADLARQTAMWIVDVGDLPWFEVDTPEDLVLAQEIFAPVGADGAG